MTDMTLKRMVGAQRLDSLHLNPQRLDTLPVETLCDLFSELDLDSALALAKSRLLFARVFEENWAFILFSILSRDFTPFESLLRIDAALPEGLDAACWRWKKRRIYFGGRLTSKDDPGCLADFNFERKHMARLIRVCKVVKQWEFTFPRLRFAQAPPDERRSLQPREKERLRRALYIWWRYALAHHSVEVSSRRCFSVFSVPRTPFDDLRTASTAQLYELRDLWRTLRSAVSTDLCPLNLTVQDSGRHIWGGYLQSGMVRRADSDMAIRRVMKLAPDDLLHYLQTWDKFHSRDQLERDMLLRCPSFMGRDGESLGSVLDTMIDGRMADIKKEEEDEQKQEGDDEQDVEEDIEPGCCCLDHSFPKPDGGILDHEDVRSEELRVKYDKDGGKLYKR